MRGQRPALDRSLDPARCVGPTAFIDSGHASIARVAHRVYGGSEPEPRLRAVRLFEYVRDEITYEFRAKLTPDEYRASRILGEGRGFCVQKAVLLCALLRTAQLPAAMVMCDLQDHTLPPRIVAAMGTDTMFHHGLCAVYLDGRWILADASLSSDIVARRRYRRVEFDGHRDALFPETTLDGTPHARVVEFHGMHSDLPFAQMLRTFTAAYARADAAALAALGYTL